jgi:hypothetical protein
MAAVEVEGREHPDVEAVTRWRFEALIRAGYDDQDAIELAFHTEVDLHWAVDLLRRGCPSATAVRIAL